MMDPTTPAPERRLQVYGTVSLTGPTGGLISVRGLGDRIAFDIERSVLSFGLLSRRPSRVMRAQWLQAGQWAPELSQVSVEFSVNGYPIGRLDRNSRVSVLARLLGLDPVDLSLRRLLIAWVGGPSKTAGA